MTAIRAKVAAEDAKMMSSIVKLKKTKSLLTILSECLITSLMVSLSEESSSSILIWTTYSTSSFLKGVFSATNFWNSDACSLALFDTS